MKSITVDCPQVHTSLDPNSSIVIKEIIFDVRHIKDTSKESYITILSPRFKLFHFPMDAVVPIILMKQYEKGLQFTIRWPKIYYYLLCVFFAITIVCQASVVLSVLGNGQMIRLTMFTPIVVFVTVGIIGKCLFRIRACIYIREVIQTICFK